METPKIDFEFEMPSQSELIAVNDVEVRDTAIRPVDEKNPGYINLLESLRAGDRVLSPIIVKRCLDLATGLETYELVEGGHRLHASKVVGYDTIPAFILPEDTPRHITMGIQIRSNTQRIQQSPVQEGKQYERIMAEVQGITVAQLARLVGRSEAVVRDRLKFTEDKLDSKIINLVESGSIPADNARELAKASKSLQTDELIQAAMTLTPSELKERIDSTKKALHNPEPAKVKEPKVFEAKYKPRDRAIVEAEIASGDLAKAKFEDPALQEAFSEGVRWVVSLDEDTVTLSREEFERKASAADEAKKQKELEKKKQKLEELKADLEVAPVE